MIPVIGGDGGSHLSGDGGDDDNLVVDVGCDEGLGGCCYYDISSSCGGLWSIGGGWW